MTYEFLSPQWFAEADRIRTELGDGGPLAVVVVMNLIITEVPFGDSPLHVHLDTSIGILAIDHGHHTAADMKVTLDWATAKALLIEGNPQIAMSAFMAGKIRIEGDMAKLVAFQNVKPDPQSERVILRLREITA